MLRSFQITTRAARIIRPQVSPIASRATTRRAFAHTSRPAPRTKAFTFSSRTPPPPQSILQRLFHSSRRRFNEIPKAGAKPEPEPQGLGARMKKLGREYGWSAVGVYAALCVIDFPFCYLLVRTLGTDRIGEWEEVVISNVKKVIPESVKTRWSEWRKAMKNIEKETGTEDLEMAGWGVKEADKNYKAEASLATQLALAYAIHKSFIFIRVPITVALTPRIVKMLRGWGWDIGKRTTKEAKAIKRAANPVVKKR